MEYIIGEIFKYNGEWYQAVDNTNSIMCSGCTFVNGYNECEADISVVGNCGCKDGNPLIFKKLKKVGDPYTTSVDKTVQNYLLETAVSVPPKDVFTLINNEQRLIAIEIKQNKEDMEGSVEGKLFCDKVAKANAEYMKVKLNSSLKSFDIEAAKAGKPVCTRDGRKVRIIAFDAKRKNKRSIIALVPSKDYPGFEDLIAYPNDGNYYGGHENDGDLMMLPEKKEGWVNVYKDGLLDTRVYNTKKEAFDKASPRDYVDTVRISWEESE